MHCAKNEDSSTLNLLLVQICTKFYSSLHLHEYFYVGNPTALHNVAQKYLINNNVVIY